MCCDDDDDEEEKGGFSVVAVVSRGDVVFLWLLENCNGVSYVFVK